MGDETRETDGAARQGSRGHERADRRESERDERTRRDCVKAGGTLVAGGFLAGCGGDTGSGPTPSTPTTEPATAGGTDTPTPTATDGSYTVEMAPVGEVAFEAVPTSVLAYYPIAADAVTALGHGDAIDAIGYDRTLFGDTVDYYYDALDGVAFEWEDLGRVTASDDPGTLDRERFYELDSDLHLLDPCLLRSSAFGWGDAEVESIATDVGPWFGNYYSRTNARPPEGCRDRYDYYGLWEYIAKIAAVFREDERFRALEAIHDEVVEGIRSSLPPAAERPTVAVVAYTGGTFWPYDFTQSGYLWAHLRPFGVANAFATVEGGPGADGSYDYEALVEAAPDVVLRYWGTALGQTFLDNRSEVLADPLASEVPAFRNDRYYASGNGMQGPILNLFQLEMTAKQLFPDTFGEWPGFGDGQSYPEIPERERLFDRDEVASVVHGEF